MFINNKKTIRLLFFLTITAGCSKQNGFGSNLDDYYGGTAPVVVQNATAFRPDPTVTSSLAPGDSSIKITLTIAAPSQRTIKEITKVATNTSFTAIQSAGSTGFYNVPAIPVNGATVTFTTSIREYITNNPKTDPKTLVKDTELANRYYFRLTLDDGSVVYPTPVRVLLVP